MVEEHRLTTLDSGVRIVTEEMPSVRSVSLGFWVGTGSRAETDDEARFLFSSLQQATLNNRLGQPGRVPPPVENFEATLDPYRRAVVDDAFGAAVVGGPETVRRGLDDLVAACGPDRPVAVCRELTKLHEEVWRGSLGEAAKRSQTVKPRGEYVIVLGQASEQLPGGPPSEELGAVSTEPL